MWQVSVALNQCEVFHVREMTTRLYSVWTLEQTQVEARTDSGLGQRRSVLRRHWFRRDHLHRRVRSHAAL